VAIAAFMRPIDSLFSSLSDGRLGALQASTHVALLFLLSESETFSVSTNTTDAMLLQRDRSEGECSIEPTQREGLIVQRTARANTARWSGYGCKPDARLTRSASLLMTQS